MPSSSGPAHRMRGGAVLIVQWLAAALALTVLLVTAALAWYERLEELDDADARATLMARMLEDHVTQTVESAALTLRTLGEGIATRHSVAPEPLQGLMSDALLGLPFLRSVAVLDLDGVVLASSLPAELGLRLDLSTLGPMPREGGEQLLRLLPGRGLADLGAQPAARPRAVGVSLLPLVRRMQVDGRQLLLMAVINPGALANFQQVAMSDAEGLAVLSDYEGRIIVATERLSHEPGNRLGLHPVFRDWLPAREHGSYLGEGVLPGRQVVAFRVSRTRPLVVLVEQGEAAALEHWSDRIPGLLAIAAAVLLLIVFGAGALLRSLLAREQDRRDLDHAHDQVARRERELSVVMKSVQELIFRTDADGVITFVNARWDLLSQSGAGRAIGRRLADTVLPEDREKLAALFRPDERLGVRTAEVSARTRAGTHHRFAVSVVPLRADDRIVGFAGSAVDVSERHQAQQQLQQQLAFTGQLLEISPQPVSMFDAQGRYVTVNQAWEAFTGRARADIIGTPVGHFMPTDEATLHASHDARLLAQGGRLRYETPLRHQDGTLRDMVVTKVLVPDGRGGSAGVLCTLMDVSEFREAERATREARDVAEEASRSKSEFIANISHELRTPLQSILGFSELGTMRGRAQPLLAGMFADIQSAGQRMLALVNDLLDVSKIDSTVGAFHLERCDVRQVLRGVADELNLLTAQRGLHLELRLGDAPLRAKIDPQRIAQVVRNVLANAIKFSPGDAGIELAAGLTPEHEIHITVADRGPGIPEGELEQVFEAFVQSSKTKDGSGGTGLGLAICRKIVDVHGGRIHAENRTGGGAVFHVHLPARSASETQWGGEPSVV